MRIVGNVAVLAAISVLISAGPASAAISGLQRVASGLTSPIFVTHAPGDRSRLFIAERGSPGESVNATAAIKILDLNTGSVLATPFLTIPGIDNVSEGGLLGMAFHPDYSVNGKFYVYVTVDPDGTQMTESPPMVSHIRQYTVSANPNVASTSFTPVLSFDQPQNNHNGGWIGFSPNDDYLYIATGDGGGGNDSGTGHSAGGNAQDTTSNLLGKILRINVNADDFGDATKNYAIPPTNPFKAGVGAPGDDVGDDEIWSYGLRNPFRASFDRIRGDLWIGDVGQDNREEIDFQPFTSTGGENYGWRLREGNIATPTGGVGGSCPTCVEPIYAYTHPDTTVGPVSPAEYRGNLVTGGYVYRGPDPSLQGKYFFLDAAGNNHWMVDSSPFGTVTNIDSLLTPNVGSAGFAVSFGEDAVGNLYIVYTGSGEVYRIATNQLLRGDFDADGDVDSADVVKWRAGFGSTNPNAASDGNGNAMFDAADYVVWRKNLGASLHASAGAGAAIPEPLTFVAVAQLAAVITLMFRRRSARIMNMFVESRVRV
jgi:glucose/arabinose dehydrogenase